METFKAFLKRKDIVFSGRRYGIDAMSAMAQGLFCSLLIGTILNTLGTQLHLEFLVNVGSFASSMSGAAMAVAIGWALKAPPLVLFSLATVGYAANLLGSTIVDVIFGTLATLLACLVTYKLRNIRFKGLALAASLPPVVFNAVIIGIEIAVMFPDPSSSAPLWLACVTNGISVGIGILFGYLPAKKAAALNPIDALHYD